MLWALTPRQSRIAAICAHFSSEGSSNVWQRIRHSDQGSADTGCHCVRAGTLLVRGLARKMLVEPLVSALTKQ
jgi:hypothetical protein